MITKRQIVTELSADEQKTLLNALDILGELQNSLGDGWDSAGYDIDKMITDDRYREEVYSHTFIYNEKRGNVTTFADLCTAFNVLNDLTDLPDGHFTHVYQH